MSDALYIVASGSRFGPDEADPRRLPDGVSFGSAADGGFTSLDWGVRRLLNDETLEQMYGPVKVIDDQGQTVWQGELRRPSPSSIVGTKSTVSPSAVGLKELREDRKDVRWLGLDRDLSRWGAARAARQTAWNTSNFTARTASVEDGTLKFDCSGAWTTAAGRPAVLAQYDASPLTVRQILWGSATTTGMLGAQWVGEVLGQDRTGNSTSGGTSTDFITVDSGDQGALSRTINQPIAEIVIYSTAMTGVDGGRSTVIRNPIVVGDHGISAYGTSSADYGLRPDDIIRYLIAQYCPGLVAGDIQVSPIAVPHTVSLDPTTVGAIANDLNGYLGWTNAVWENGEWDFHPFGAGRRSRTWQVDVNDEGVTLTRAGDDGSTILSGVVVAYRDGGGRTLTVGPGGSIAHAFDERLRDTTSAASQAGRERIDVYDLACVSTQEVATLAGQVYLASKNAAKRSGTAEVKGRVLDVNSGERVPSYWMRGGDMLIVTGRGDRDPIRIVEQTNADGVNRLTLDSGDQDASQIFSSLLANQLVGRL